MKTKYVKPMMMGVFESIAAGDACAPGSIADPANCVTGGRVDGPPQPPAGCTGGSQAGGEACTTGNVVASCFAGGAPTSSCVTGIGVQ